MSSGVGGNFVNSVVYKVFTKKNKPIIIIILVELSQLFRQWKETYSESSTEEITESKTDLCLMLILVRIKRI